MSNVSKGPFKRNHQIQLLSIDRILGVLNKTAFSPFAIVGAPILAYLLDKRSAPLPEAYPSPSFSQFKYLLSSETPFPWLRRLFYFVLVRTLSSVLNRYARNHGEFKRDKPDWKKDVIVITGGGNGIGKCLVEYLSQVHHAKIAVLDFGPPLYRPAPAGAPPIVYVKTDVSSVEAVKEAGKQVRAQLGEPSFLVNCAGIASGGAIQDVSIDSAKRVWQINTMSYWITCQEFMPNMIKRNHGHIVTVASGASYACLPSMSEYAVSKAGALAFHEVLSQEFRSRYFAPRVRTTIVCPLKVTTQLGEGMEHARNQFTTPTLEPEYVAEQIAEALNSGLSHYLLMPALANVSPWLRVFPAWLVRLIGIISGFDDTVTDKSIKRTLSKGYGNNWEGADKGFFEHAKAKIMSK